MFVDTRGIVTFGLKHIDDYSTRSDFHDVFLIYNGNSEWFSSCSLKNGTLYSFFKSLISLFFDSCMCPDLGWNPPPWHMGWRSSQLSYQVRGNIIFLMLTMSCKCSHFDDGNMYHIVTYEKGSNHSRVQSLQVHLVWPLSYICICLGLLLVIQGGWQFFVISRAGSFSWSYMMFIWSCQSPRLFFFAG